MIKDLNLLIATHILQGHKCNASKLPLHILSLCVFPHPNLYHFKHLQKHKAVYSQHFWFLFT